MAEPQSNLPAALTDLRAILGGDRLSTSADLRAQHGRGESYHPPKSPDAVAFPRTTDEVSEIVKVCAKHHLPIIPFGAGTSVEGHLVALHGGLSLDFRDMNRVVEIHAADMDATVEAGVTRTQLNEALRGTGLFFPIDPGADATLGGMAATRASGTNAVRYGTMRDNVIALTAVLSDGRIVRTARRARKSSAGYDITRLLVGSEGTLGIITEVTVRLYGVPEAMTSALCSFPTIDDAVRCAMAVIQYGVPVARMELLDEKAIEACNAYSHVDMTPAPTLFFEFHGSTASAAEQAETAQSIAADHNGGEFRWSADPQERAKLWHARHEAYWAAMALRPGCTGWPSDICVPISRLAEAIAETKADLEQSFLLAPIVGHVGDGNFHVLFVVDRDNETEIAELKRLNKRMVERALRMDGTCTGEHGVGYGKIEFLKQEHGVDMMTVMSAIKATMDPLNILNPGKVVPETEWVE